MDSLIALRTTNDSNYHSTATTTPQPHDFTNIQILGPPYTRNLRIALLSLMIVTAFLGNIAVILNITLIKVDIYKR